MYPVSTSKTFLQLHFNFQTSDASNAVKLSKWCPLPGALPSSVIVDYAFHCIAILCNCWLCIARLGLSNSSPFFPSASYWARQLFFQAKGALIKASGFLLLCKSCLQSTLFEFQWRCTISFASFYVQSWLGLILSLSMMWRILAHGKIEVFLRNKLLFSVAGSDFSVALFKMHQPTDHWLQFQLNGIHLVLWCVHILLNRSEGGNRMQCHIKILLQTGQCTNLCETQI